MVTTRADSFKTIDGILYLYKEFKEDGENYDDWYILDKDHHPAFNYVPLNGVTTKYYIVKE